MFEAVVAKSEGPLPAPAQQDVEFRAGEIPGNQEINSFKSTN
jgi:hypothetical protein